MTGTILTAVGKAKIASATPEAQLQITHVAVGDGNGSYPVLTENMVALANEVWRGTSSTPIRDQAAPNTLMFESAIPPDIGGFTIREIGIFDVDGDMIAIGHVDPAQVKPLPTTTTAVNMTVRMIIALANAEQTNLVLSVAPVVTHNGLADRDVAGAHPASAIGYGDGNVAAFLDSVDQFIKNSRIVNVKSYGAKIDGVTDDTAAIHAAFAANPKCNIFYFPTGTCLANISIPRPYIKLLGDGPQSSIIRPFDKTLPAVDANGRLYSGYEEIAVRAGQDYLCEQLVDVRDVRYLELTNFDTRKTIETGETHGYQTILVDHRSPTAGWTGYNKFRNVYFTYGAFGYLTDVDKLNSVPNMENVLASFNGYFGIKMACSNGSLTSLDVANNGKLAPAGVYDETQYGGMYIKGDNTAIRSLWHEYNANSLPSYSPNNVYIHPDSSNIENMFQRDTRGSNNVRVFTQSQGQLQNVNTADRALDGGDGRARDNQIIKNGLFKFWDSTLNRPRGWGGYFSGTWTQETTDLPKGYDYGLKVVSNAAGVCGIYQAIYNPNDLTNSLIKDITKWIGREITVSFWVKNIGSSTTAIRGGISTDSGNVYFTSGNYVAATPLGEFTKVIASIKVTGAEARIWAGVRVAGIGEGMIVAGFSGADDCRIADAQYKPITEDGGEVFGNLEVRGTFTNGGVSPVFRPTVVTTTDLTNAAGSINTVDKYLGKQVFNNSDLKMYYATGTTATSGWKSFDGATTITPV